MIKIVNLYFLCEHHHHHYYYYHHHHHQYDYCDDKLQWEMKTGRHKWIQLWRFCFCRAFELVHGGSAATKSLTIPMMQLSLVQVVQASERGESWDYKFRWAVFRINKYKLLGLDYFVPLNFLNFLCRVGTQQRKNPYESHGNTGMVPSD